MGIMPFKHLEVHLSKHRSSSRKQNPTVITELCHQFSLSDLRKSTNNFDESRLVEREQFSNFYRGCLKHNIGATDCTVVAKEMKSSCFSHSYLSEAFKKEIELLCQLNHPNLVSLIGFCDHKNEKILVYEDLYNGSLKKHLYDKVMEPLSWKKRLEICIGTARGLHYLHSGIKRTIIHRGIKPSNILLNGNMVPKITEFTLSLRGPRFMSKPKPIQGDITGTLFYMARECVLDGTFSDKSDVFAFGTILLEVVCAKTPEKIFGATPVDTPIEERIDPVLKGKIAPECWEIFIDLTKRCLKLDPNERPIIGEVEVELEHALSLQEEADIRDNNGNYTLFPNTIIDFSAYDGVWEPEPEQEQRTLTQRAPIQKTTTYKSYAKSIMTYMVRFLTKNKQNHLFWK